MKALDRLTGTAVEAAFTVRLIVVEAVSEPDVPLTVTVTVPVVALLLAVRVNTLVFVVGLVANDAVTPLGKPVAARVTLPEKPFAGTTVMVSVAVAPCVIVKVDVSESVKKAGGLTVTLTVTEDVNEPEVPVIITG